MASQTACRRCGIALLAFMSIGGLHAQAQTQPRTAPEGQVVVIGEGTVRIAPDYAQIEGGVTTRAKTVKEATDATSKTMAAVAAALLDSGIPQSDIQTSRFSIAPVYAAQEPRAEPKLTGYSVTNQVRVNIRQIGKVGHILDRLVAAGVTNVGNIAFLVTDPSKPLDQAREAAIADARRKAETYARASGVQLGKVTWITEDSGFAPPFAMRAGAPSGMAAAAVPISTGEDTLHARVTVAFEIARQ
jgi:uncharacterized protein YggE